MYDNSKLRVGEDKKLIMQEQITKFLFVATDKSKLKKPNKNLDILNHLVGMVGG